ncbi:DNA repair protein RecN [Stutzerimonas stutzeri]|jgi:DNA repair protein RecN (Recombination protein N)|uniref:DNA repair protein RecN n=1 Tax=Stutzerimonas stutzeri (strain ATCC 17588 / DSM 5190 / CCUG 11256 / JCM 5965 / LMG 11199 / NBRC 14165 / NCIMB 11358 / Stanier 221) TaxID=96563 RepID=F8GZL1_STUS2|nr:DNA repair protein RecN [Stutzerimonas stutzeri]MPS56936.1 DNA repair protein RecN [Pseudomonas sp.]AEJ06655.1 DNA repair protein RecN [Stutzerimonas stutzeri]KOR10480.1 recombination and repair protein [Stutzerimonas stutzeri]MCQ4238533.1 DNA repair protein RecN [Stutzerimonas stutzeri]MDH0214012.1 DNA repair protein RecN [Stutzerimonas stutzeri]
MLVHLSVHNYAIVEHLDLELKRGMSVISGETGAGKSIMLDALGLTLGDRADSSVVRIGADKADILASFDLDDIPDARAWLAERDMDSEGPCILRRVITAEGRSRGYINGTPCPQGDLKALGELLIDIHSQHEHQSLLKTDTHRRLLDEYSGSQDLARQVQLAAQRWRQTRQTLERLSNSSDEQRARHQLLSYQLEELENLALGEHELEQLEQEHKNLANAEQLLGACRQVMELCSESDAGNVLSALTSSLQRLTAFQNQPQALSEAVNLLASAQIQVEEAIGELNRFVDHFDADPERQQMLEERLDTIYTLARKHRVQPSELPNLHQQLLEELEGLNADDEAVERLGEELAAYARHYEEKAGELSCNRQAAAEELASAVEAEIQRLGMPGGRFSVQLKPAAEGEYTPYGLEQVEFLVSANPGQPLRPLAKVASGGELSRISLAIQVITAQTSRVPTLVFDEVDVGIGGPTAEIVGQLLRRLGERGQVLTVTHLPQVAAQGHHHLFVHKARDTDETRTAVTELDQAGRVEEIARMLGGVDLTEQSLAHARQMVTSAQA